MEKLYEDKNGTIIIIRSDFGKEFVIFIPCKFQKTKVKFKKRLATAYFILDQ